MRRRITDSTAGSYSRIIGGVLAFVAGSIWIASASKMGAPPVFVLFGVVFLLAAAGHIVVGAYNAKAEPSDRLGTTEIVDLPQEQDSAHFCSQCGKSLTAGAKFCGHCGTKVA